MQLQLDEYDAWEITVRDAAAALARKEALSPEESTVWRDAVASLVANALDDCDDDMDLALDALAARVLAAESRLATV